MARYFTPFAQAFDTSGNTIAGAKLYFYEQGTTTPQDTFTDDTLTTPNTNPVIADGGGFFPDIFLQLTTYTVDYTDADDVTIKTADIDGTESPLLSSFIASAGVSGTDPDAVSQAVSRYAVSGAMFYTDNGAADAYILSGMDDFVIPDTFQDGWLLRFRPSNNNTGPSTVNVNTLGAKDIVAFDGTALTGGEINSGEDIELAYDLANDRFKIINAPTIIPNIVFKEEYVSADQTITAAGSLTLAHSLSSTPYLLGVTLKCTTAEGGYSIGDEFIWPFGLGITNSTYGSGVSLTVDGTNLNVRFADSGAGIFSIPNKGTGAYFAITATSWDVVFRAWA